MLIFSPLQEFHLSSPDTLRLIIENVQSLASVQDPGLVSVQAIFKDEVGALFATTNSLAIGTVLWWPYSILCGRIKDAASVIFFI